MGDKFCPLYEQIYYLLLATSWPKWRFAIIECMFQTFSLRFSCTQLIQPSNYYMTASLILRKKVKRQSYLPIMQKEVFFGYFQTELVAKVLLYLVDVLYKGNLLETRQMSFMIHTALPTVSPVVNIVFAWNLFCFGWKDGRTDGQHERRQWSISAVTVGRPSGSIYQRKSFGQIISLFFIFTAFNCLENKNVVISVLVNN